ncbi:Sodium/hydrogen exchanger family-domain-containing protein [Mucor mucedo]|uniref:Sodium/hydrogen exchanger family-domain-containing protein n=1 Tax=Mucor mucedo TaxID=29922 RepID=UPI00221FF87E|nr:Sodium/hydrogen exchanger family-domain-containing protein [Mucor mucedo]KAI7895587.1 Sodium/hydrogen exchanger family-domain-containing protein [Mucor mucedo]
MADAATPQAGVFSGLNPAHFNSSDPIVLFIIQVAIILAFCRIIAIPLGYLRQPKVISEVIAGIILGPTAMGRIPGFKQAIFPAESLPFLNLIATLGLVFFLFQVGLEVDVQVIKKDWRKSVSIAVAGMALPFGLGAAVSVGLYKLQNDSSIPFGSFLLFLGVAMSITAFPVLARILAELKLLRTKVGAITMASGLINDCTAWVLLALVVALLNSSGGIVALYVFLTAVGFTIFVIFGVGPLYRKLCVRTNSFEDGPSPLLMTVTLMIVLLCAFVTDIIGVHAIFGGFLAGVIIPHEHDLSIKITEKIEDMINIIFLPLYFTLSGLKTQIGLLDTGIVWGYVILVIFLACFGKIIGCTAAAKLSGMTTRESLAVGFLMNCKGLVELIVLNLGHDAGVLNDQVFVIMVVMALVTTFMTTPVVLYVYPEWYQKQTAVDDSPTLDNRVDFVSQIDEKGSIISSIEHKRYCVVTMLNRIESVPSMMALIQLFKRDRVNVSAEMHALRLLELTERTSVVMKYKDLRESERQDPILNVFRTFSNLISMKSLQTHLDYCPSTEYIKTVSDYGAKVSADLILLPWINRYLINNENYASALADVTSTADVEFVSQAFSTIHHCTTGLFIDRGFGQVHDGEAISLVQIMVLYREDCEDDKAGLLFALQLQTYKKVHLTIIRKGSETGALLYATDESIQHYIEDHNIDTLFTTHADTTSHVSCQFVPDMSGSGITKHLTRPLDKHDLVILGRRYDGTSIDEDQDYENALGKMGFSVLKNESNNTSVLIIQSASSK